jgi:anti-anti-sigma factor
VAAESGAFYVFRVSVEVAGTDGLVRPRGELDIFGVPRMEDAFDRAARLSVDRVVLDLEELDFIDAAGLGALMQASNVLGERLFVRSAGPQVRQLLALTGLGEALQFEDRSFARRDGYGEFNLAYVRRLWRAFEMGGGPAVAELVPDDVEWVPLRGEGRVLRTRAEFSSFWGSRPHPLPAAREFQAVGDNVVARFEASGPSGSPKQIWSLYRFAGHRLIQAISFEQEADARLAAAA